MTGVELVPLVDEGLGNSAYLVDLGDGRALVVDVSRDLRAVHAAAARRPLPVLPSAVRESPAFVLAGPSGLLARLLYQQELPARPVKSWSQPVRIRAEQQRQPRT